MKKNILLALALAASFGAGRADATIVMSSVSVAGVLAIPAPTANTTVGTQYVKLKAARLCNDSAVNTCVNLQDSSGVKKLALCASAQSCSDGPKETPFDGQFSGTPSPIAAYFGEVFQSTFTTGYSVLGSTPSALIYVHLSYDYTNSLGR